MLTTEIYNKHSSEFIERYDNANMSSLHKLLLKYISPTSSVLDIGFGSGRDLQFLYDNGYDIWGIDPSKKFVENALIRFPTHVLDHFFEASVPFSKELFRSNIKFDAVISIAMWMHLEHSKYADVVNSITSVAKTISTVVISYSEGIRGNDLRYFEDVDLLYITELFYSKDFKLAESVKSGDILNRYNLTWITVVFKHN